MGHLHALEPEGGRRRIRVTSPVDGSEVCVITVETAEDVRARVARAREVQREWANVPVKERARLMQRALDILVAEHEQFIERLTHETGRAELDTLMIEIYAACDSMNFYSRNAAGVLADRTVGLHLMRHKKAKLVTRPMGVIGVISPWNGPFVLSINPTIQAVLAGNAVIIKPSEVTPTAGMLAVELFERAGFPPGLVQCALGDGETGAALLESGVDKISFTGSVATGRKVGEACGRNLVPCTLELGGKDAMIVCGDADVERAAGGAMFGGLMNAGQFCSAVERVYVVESIAPQFLETLVRKMGELEIGRDIGPFIFQPQQGIVKAHVDQAVAAGARVLIGGQPVGNAFQPTVVTDIPEDQPLLCEETFGPVLAVAVVKDEEDAIAKANDNRYGLGASVWSRDKRRAEAIARRLEAGAVTINETALTYGALELPFGGVKQSGIGRVNGADGLLNFSHVLPIISDRFGSKEEPVWYPYTPDKVENMRKGLKMMFGTPLKWVLR